jgi:hypothetical protein
MRILLLILLFFSATSTFAQSGLTDNDTPTVDVELVLALDVSYSMDKDKLALLREGYAQAIVSEEFIQALKANPNGRLAVTYFEWSVSNYQKIIVPWRVIDGPDAAAAVAAEIMKAPAVSKSRTSISGAINFAMSLFDNDPNRGTRRVIDISGDGPNNSGEPVLEARNAALAKGVTIDGLPIRNEPPGPQDIEHLDHYYEDCVTGGPGSSVTTIEGRDNFQEAIRSMLVREVAGPAKEHPNISSTGQEKRISCSIGEEMSERIWKQPSGVIPFNVPGKKSQFTAWQQAEFMAHTKKCFDRQKEPVRNRVDISVSIGPDGMIIGEPEIKDPIENDDFRRDAKTALKEVRQCQPYIVDPFGRVRVPFAQTFIFGHERDEAMITAAMQAHFRTCWTASRTGPTIRVMLNYKPDGTYASPPLLINPEDTTEYSRTAARVMRQLNRCSPLKIPKDKYDQLRTLRWQFPSDESAKASRSKKT